MSDRFVRFDRREDNTGQKVQAADINTIQAVVEDNQKEIYRARDRSFLDRCLFTLDNHRAMNGMWIDFFETTNKIDISKTKGLLFSEPEQAVVFNDVPPDNFEGWLYSETWSNPNSTIMKNVLVLVESTIPENTDIVVEISNNGSDWFLPTINVSEPFQIATNGSRLKLRARYVRSQAGITPRIEGWAVLYKDEALNVIRMPDGTPIDMNPGGGDNSTIKLFHSQLMEIGPDDHHDQLHTHDGTDGSGLISHSVLTDIGEDDHHAKDHTHGEDGVSFVNLENDVIGTLGVENLSYQVWSGRPGQTGMFFDPKLGDRLTYVKTPDDETYMFYDMENEGRLDHTIAIREGIATYERLVYSPYTDSTNTTSIKMMGTEKFTYDATDEMIRRDIDKLIAPDQVKGVAVSDPQTGGALEVTWAKNSEYDLVGYRVYFATSTQSWMPATDKLITGVSHTLTGLIDGTEYQIKVVAVDQSEYVSIDSGVVKGTPSLKDTIAPDKPSSMSASGGDGSVYLAWAPNTEDDLATYALYRSPSGLPGSFLRIKTILKSETSYTDTGGIVSGSPYYYYVTAIDVQGNESVASETVVATA